MFNLREKTEMLGSVVSSEKKYCWLFTNTLYQAAETDVILGIHLLGEARRLVVLTSVG